MTETSNQLHLDYSTPEEADPELHPIEPDELHEIFREETDDERWLRENCERLSPDFHSREGGYTKALELLALDLRSRITFNADDLTRLVSLAEKIKHTILN